MLTIGAACVTIIVVLYIDVVMELCDTDGKVSWLAPLFVDHMWLSYYCFYTASIHIKVVSLYVAYGTVIRSAKILRHMRARRQRLLGMAVM